MFGKMFLEPRDELAGCTLGVFATKTVSGSFQYDELAGNLRRLKQFLDVRLQLREKQLSSGFGNRIEQPYVCGAW